MLIRFIAGATFFIGTTAGQPAQPASTLKADVRRLVTGAEKLARLWPWQGPIPEVALVVRHGTRVAPLLIALLDDDPGDPSPGASDWRVQQQAALALCRIFGVTEECGHVYCNRAARDVNKGVKKFWSAKISGVGRQSRSA